MTRVESTWQVIEALAVLDRHGLMRVEGYEAPQGATFGLTEEGAALVERLVAHPDLGPSALEQLRFYGNGAEFLVATVIEVDLDYDDTVELLRGDLEMAGLAAHVLGTRR